MKWSPQQDTALQNVAHWFANESKQKKIFRLFGCAGTGKTTLAKHFAEAVDGTVKFATFTGKAAHIMAQKGCVGASTIHRLIYRPKMNSKARLWELEEELDQAKASPDPDWDKINNLQEEFVKEQDNASRMGFSLNLESELRNASLLIIDEVSMVDMTVGSDLESFGVPILVLGDPEQLPPIYGEGHFTAQSPDIMLTEIHRQALDNPIIQMSKIVREGGSLQLGQYGNSRVVSEKLDDEDILSHEAILTGLRKTKRACDVRSRVLLGRTSSLPIAGDKLMCVKNNHLLGLLNGQTWICTEDAVQIGGGEISLHIKDPDSDNDMVVCAAEKLFYGEALSRWEHQEDVEEFEYAYAITVHKAQGSQYDSVLLFDQKDKFPNFNERDKRRWLYTGITRAAERVTVMRL